MPVDPNRFVRSSQIQPILGVLFRNPRALGLRPALRTTAAPAGETVMLQGQQVRYIECGRVDDDRLDGRPGPHAFVITDGSRVIRHVGCHQGTRSLRARWFEDGFVHIDHKVRGHCVSALQGGHGPLTVWSATAEELRPMLPATTPRLRSADLVSRLADLWASRWQGQQWNPPAEVPAFSVSDGGYWANA